MLLRKAADARSIDVVMRLNCAPEEDAVAFLLRARVDAEYAKP
jgi:hypothetical protein